VDVGRTDEQAGKISEALKRYSEATSLDPYSPTPYLRKGILESRQGKQKEADADFAAAEKIYATNINLEGTAEVDYQRSTNKRVKSPRTRFASPKRTALIIGRPTPGSGLVTPGPTGTPKSPKSY